MQGFIKFFLAIQKNSAICFAQIKTDMNQNSKFQNVYISFNVFLE